MGTLKETLAKNLRAQMETRQLSNEWLTQRAGITIEELEDLLNPEGNINTGAVEKVAKLLRFKQSSELLNTELKPPQQLQEIIDASFGNCYKGDDPAIQETIKLFEDFLDVTHALRTAKGSSPEVSAIQPIKLFTAENSVEAIRDYLAEEGKLLMTPVDSLEYFGLITYRNGNTYMHVNSNRIKAAVNYAIISLYLKGLTQVEEIKALPQKTFIAMGGYYATSREVSEMVIEHAEKFEGTKHPRVVNTFMENCLADTEITDMIRQSDVEEFHKFLAKLNTLR